MYRMVNNKIYLVTRVVRRVILTVCCTVLFVHFIKTIRRYFFFFFLCTPDFIRNAFFKIHFGYFSTARVALLGLSIHTHSHTRVYKNKMYTQHIRRLTHLYRTKRLKSIVAPYKVIGCETTVYRFRNYWKKTIITRVIHENVLNLVAVNERKR